MMKNHARCLALALGLIPLAGQAANFETINVHMETPFQIIDGFGAASTQFNGIYANPAYRTQDPDNPTTGSLAPATELFNMLFDPVAGAGLSIARSEIASSATDTSEPSPTSGFIYTTPAIYGQAWALGEARSRGVQRFYALPWSPPAWMKANNNIKGITDGVYPNPTNNTTSFLGTDGSLATQIDSDHSQDSNLTDYLRRYVQAMQKPPLSIYFGWLGLNNEMNFDGNGWSTCYYTPEKAAALLPSLQTALNAWNLGSYVTACETSNIENGTTTTAKDYLTQVFKPAGDEGIQFVTTHYYGGTDGYNNDLNASLYPNHTGLWRMWETEITKKAETDTWAEALGWASDIHNFMNAGWSAWCFWEGVGKVGETDAQMLIQIPSSGTTFAFTNRLYVMGQFAKFIRPGDQRVKCDGWDGTNIMATAYINPASANQRQILVLINNTTSSQTLGLTGLTAGKVYQVCYSDAAHAAPAGTEWVAGTNVTATAMGTGTVTVTAQSITTLNQNINDNTVPGTITDLAVTSPGSQNVKITWSAPGDDGFTGTAKSYDIRYAQGSYTASTFPWATATQWMASPPPMEATTAQEDVIYGLTSGQTFSIAIKAKDYAGNWSGVAVGHVLVE